MVDGLPDGRATLDEEVRGLLAQGNATQAAELIVLRLGPELLGYLHAVAPSAAEADDVFSAYCERLVRGLDSFRGDASVRTWSYRIARNLLIDAQRRRARERDRGGSDDGISRVAAQVRSETATFLRTSSRNRLSELRAQLDEEDRTLLVLRVDRQLSWKEVATVMLERPDTAGKARLRKRFERLIMRLRKELDESGA